MKTLLKWTQGMQFEAEAEGNRVLMDAKSPLGKSSAQTPKELVAAGLGGCTAMDVVSWLRKNKQDCQSLEIEVDIETSTSGYPSVFTKAFLTFTAMGSIDAEILLEAVHLSQTKYCGVSAMLVKAFPIHYQVVLNGETIGQGQADFGGTHE